MWVLANGLTLGQIYMFHQAQKPLIRENIAISFTNLYADSRSQRVDVTSSWLAKIYRRIKNFRNICAPDERLFYAHSHDANIIVFQLIKDLQYVTDKCRYLEFLQKIQTPVNEVCGNLPQCSQGIIEAMGMVSPTDLEQRLEKSRNL